MYIYRCCYVAKIPDRPTRLVALQRPQTFESQCLISSLCRLEADLSKIEKQIFDLETVYLEETCGANTIRGWTAFGKAVQQKKGIKFYTEIDRVFSLSSTTSPLGDQDWPTAVTDPAYPTIVAAEYEKKHTTTAAATAGEGSTKPVSAKRGPGRPPKKV